MRWVASCRLALARNGLQTAADVLVHVGVHRAHRRADSVLNRARRRLAMRDDADAAHAQQRRPAMLGIIEVLESRRKPFGLDAGALENTEHHRRYGLIELEHDVTDESIADDDVDGSPIALASWQIAALDVADEVQAGFAQHLVRFLHRSEERRVGKECRSR